MRRFELGTKHTRGGGVSDISTATLSLPGLGVSAPKRQARGPRQLPHRRAHAPRVVPRDRARSQKSAQREQRTAQARPRRPAEPPLTGTEDNARTE